MQFYIIHLYFTFFFNEMIWDELSYIFYLVLYILFNYLDTTTQNFNMLATWKVAILIFAFYWIPSSTILIRNDDFWPPLQVLLKKFHLKEMILNYLFTIRNNGDACKHIILESTFQKLISWLIILKILMGKILISIALWLILMILNGVQKIVMANIIVLNVRFIFIKILA